MSDMAAAAVCSPVQSATVTVAEPVHLVHVAVVDLNCRGVGAIRNTGEIPGHLSAFTRNLTTSY